MLLIWSDAAFMVFIKRTVSKARRTISSAGSSRAASPVTAGPNSACSNSSATLRTGSPSGAYAGGPDPTRPKARRVWPRTVSEARTKPSQPSSR